MKKLLVSLKSLKLKHTHPALGDPNTRQEGKWGLDDNDDDDNASPYALNQKSIVMLLTGTIIMYHIQY